MEEELGIMVYRLRIRPQIGPFKLHYDWALYVIGIVYGFLTARYVGLKLFAGGIGLILGLYLVLFLLSYWQDVEPLEKQLKHSYIRNDEESKSSTSKAT